MFLHLFALCEILILYISIKSRSYRNCNTLSPLFLFLDSLFFFFAIGNGGGVSAAGTNVYTSGITGFVDFGVNSLASGFYYMHIKICNTNPDVLTEIFIKKINYKYQVLAWISKNIKIECLHSKDLGQ